MTGNKSLGRVTGWTHCKRLECKNRKLLIDFLSVFHNNLQQLDVYHHIVFYCAIQTFNERGGDTQARLKYPSNQIILSTIKERE